MAARLPLNALHTFEAVAGRLSFTAGAEALHVTPAAVSSQIRALEEQLGVQLFIRKGREVRLTEAGRLLLPGVQRGMAELSRAVQSLAESREEGVVNVSMLASFLQRWLTPRLPEFYRRHPEIDLRVNANNAPVDFGATDFHAAIRFGRGKWPGLTVHKLLDEWILPVCSPELAARIGPLESAGEVDRYELLHSTDEPWEAWFAGLGGERVAPRGPTFNDSVSVVIAAEEGQGLALARWSLVAAALESGRLVQPLPRAIKSEFDYHFVAPRRLFELPKVQRLLEWLEECCRAFPRPAAEHGGIIARVSCNTD